MKRAVIIGSAPGDNWDFIHSYIKPDDMILAADGGRIICEKLGIVPDWYIGDSDSGGWKGTINADILPSEKDVTDLDMAVSRALSEGADEIILCGCTGGREDHHLSAIGQLERIWKSKCIGCIVDAVNEIRIISVGIFTQTETPAFKYFGLVPLDRKLSGVSIKNAKYEITNVDIPRESSLGISNEFIKDRNLIISIKDGVGLLIFSQRM